MSAAKPCPNALCKCPDCTCGDECTCNISPEVNCDPCIAFKAEMMAKKAAEEVLLAVTIKGSCLCGSVHWELEGFPDHATSCNCTACRRYGTLWAYGYQVGDANDKKEGENITIRGDTNTKMFMRGDMGLTFNFCTECGNMAYWRGCTQDDKGRTRIAVNIRLAVNPKEVAGIPISHFDGFDKFESLPRDGKCVSDVWF